MTARNAAVNGFVRGACHLKLTCAIDKVFRGDAKYAVEGGALDGLVC